MVLAGKHTGGQIYLVSSANYLYKHKYSTYS